MRPGGTCWQVACTASSTSISTAIPNAFGGHLWLRGDVEYTLYGIERIATLVERKQVAGKDWYREGARELLRRQKEDGSWGGAGTAGPIAGTCLALLFLRRATLTYTGSGKQHDDPEESAPAPAEPAAASPPDGPAKPNADVPYVRSWLLIGPFPHPGDAPPDAKPPLNEKRAKPRENQRVRGLKWISHHSDADRISLSKVLEHKNNSLSYAFTWLHVDTDTDIVLWLGQDDAGRVFLDGEVVYDDPFVQGGSRLGRPIPVRLSKGRHRLLIRVEEWDRGSKFYLRIARPDGSPVETVHPSPDAQR